jgi:CheY-like chemotaxis protein
MADAAPVAMVVEDEEMLAEIVGWALEDAGYSVIRAGDGEAALRSLDDVSKLDLLVTDIRMPGRVDGWMLAEKVRERLPDVPVIYVSGYTAATPRNVPNSVFVQKPFRPEQLISAIGQVC